MSDLDLFRNWRDASIDWILEHATPETHIADTAVVAEGERPRALYIVSHGLYGVSVAQGALGRQELGRLAAGSVYGEMAWLEGTVASASIRAIETSESLVLPLALLENTLAQDPLFAAEFMGAMARVLAQRLRATNAALLKHAEGALEGTSVDRRSDRVQSVMRKFKGAVARFDRDSRAGKNDIGPSLEEMRQVLGVLMGTLEDAVRSVAETNPTAADAIGAGAQLEFLPYLLATETAARFYAKPRGYAGDFLTIEHIYDRKVGGTNAFGGALDALFMDCAPAAAVRNRRELLKQRIQDITGHLGSDARIMSLACGPAREMFDALEQLDRHRWPQVTLLDIDAEALALVRRRLGDDAGGGRFRLLQANLVRLALGRERIDVPPQDLVYSIGLIDYFNDEFVVKLLGWIHERLAPSGQVILGNFHPRNPTKAFMDYVLEWRLIHRTEEAMQRLFAASPFRGCKEIVFEQAGVNLFAIGEKRA